MTTPAESTPSTDPAWLSTWQPEHPAAVADAKAAQEAAGRERMRIVRQQAFIGGPFVVLGGLLLALSGPGWLVPVAIACLVLGLVVSTGVAVLQSRRVEQRLAERLRA